MGPKPGKPCRRDANLAGRLMVESDVQGEPCLRGALASGGTSRGRVVTWSWGRRGVGSGTQWRWSLSRVSQATNQRRPCPGRKLQWEASLAMGAPKNPQNNPPGKNLASLNGSSGQSKSTPEDMGARQGKFSLSFPIPFHTSHGGAEKRRVEEQENLGAHRTPPGDPHCKMAITIASPCWLGLKAIICESAWRGAGPMKCS